MGKLHKQKGRDTEPRPSGVEIIIIVSLLT